MRVFLRHASFIAFVAFVVIACGSRTGLIGGDLADFEVDATPDVVGNDQMVLADGQLPDVDFPDAPFLEGGPLDVITDCADPAYCDPRDLGNIYKCGVPIFQCSSLETCVNAKCVNPCVDTLGQDTSNGCEFYAPEMDTVPEAEGVCYAVFIVNQWKTGEPARIEVDRGGTSLPIEEFARIPVGTGTNIVYTPYVKAQGLARDQIAILFLSRDPAAAADTTYGPAAPKVLANCPPGVTPAIVGDAAIHGTGTGTAFHIKTNVPVVSYQILPYGGGSARVTGATLLLPTNVWDNNYLAANAYIKPTIAINEAHVGPTLAILGQQDGTRVTIKPTAAIVAGGGLAAAAANVSTTYVVNRGQYLQFTQDAELTGSAIQSDQPIAVIGGSTLMDVPTTLLRGDGAQQMLPPVKALGSEYLGVRYRSRDKVNPEIVPWRIVGAVDGTTLTFDPPQAGAPATINSRQFVEFTSAGPFVVSSQGADHPFYFAQYMTGGQLAVGNDPSAPAAGEGDPEFVNVISPAQFLSRYTFFTDPTYPETNLVVTRVKDAALGLFPDVALDCAGTLSGWAPVGSTGKYEFMRIDLSTGNFQGQNGCNNGVHTMTATLPGGDGGVNALPRAGATVWGWGNPITLVADDETSPKFTRWVSYAYPVGANITQLNDVVLSAH